MKRYTWLWESNDLLTPERVDEILKFCRTRRVDVIFLQYSFNLPQAAYREFNHKAMTLGIEVHALLGERDWYLPERYQELHNRLVAIQYHNAHCSVTEMFTGIHIDIEPYTLPEWKAGGESQQQVLTQWVATMETYSLYVQAQMGLELTVSVPLASKGITYDGVSFYDTLLGLHDKVVIMSYRDFAQGSDSIVYHAEPLLVAAQVAIDRADCVIIAVEIGPNVELPKVSFQEEGVQVMYEELSEVDRYAITNYPAVYNGHAIHSLKHWMAASFTGGTR